VSTAVLPTTRKGRATRERLLAAARDLAVANGGSIEIAGVAEAAGVVPSLVHRYFGSKAGLVGAVIDDFFDRYHAAVFERPRLLPEGGWARQERRRLEVGVRFHYDEPFSVVLLGPLARDPEVAHQESRRIAAVVARAARSIRRGQREGELPKGVDPGLAGAAMFGAMRLVMMEALARSPRPRVEEVIEVLWRQVTAAVRIDPATAARDPSGTTERPLEPKAPV
jgi:AcrR family transcriptional regulator